MRERPILFSSPMVRAILAGTKTQTRRALRVQPDDKLHHGVHYDRATGGAMWGSIRGDHGIACPYGLPGDGLWVRETWRWVCPDDPDVALYRADGHAASTLPLGFKWKPSIFMPRVASRITLEVVSVRVERVQEISREDEIAESVSPGEFYDKLWDSINIKRCPWASNPWVWVVTFKPAASK